MLHFGVKKGILHSHRYLNSVSSSNDKTNLLGTMSSRLHSPVPRVRKSCLYGQALLFFDVDRIDETCRNRIISVNYHWKHPHPHQCLQCQNSTPLLKGSRCILLLRTGQNVSHWILTTSSPWWSSEWGSDYCPTLSDPRVSSRPSHRGMDFQHMFHMYAPWQVGVRWGGVQRVGRTVEELRWIGGEGGGGSHNTREVYLQMWKGGKVVSSCSSGGWWGEWVCVLALARRQTWRYLTLKCKCVYRIRVCVCVWITHLNPRV